MVIKPGVTVWVGGKVQASGLVLELLEGRRVRRDGPVQLGAVRVRLDANEEEIEISAGDIKRVL